MNLRPAMNVERCFSCFSNQSRSLDSWMHGFRPNPSGRLPRVFLYSHDTYGLGHLRRNLALAEHLLSRARRYSVRLLTGSPVIGDWALPDALDVTALPPVVKTGVETYLPRNATLPFGLVKANREAAILKSVIEEAPDILLVDHAPAGMNAELLATLALIRREMPRTTVVLGLRDILDDADQVRRIWQQQGIIPLLEHLYDRIFVYGIRELFDVVENYGIPPHIATKLSYCGYVGRAARRGTSARLDRPFTVLVTAGGGEDGYFLMEAYLKALARLPAGRFRSRIVTGPMMSSAQRNALNAATVDDPNTEIIASTTNLPTILEAADLVIAMAGYNTSVEIVASGKPAILVPRAAPRAEQRLRAAMLARLGLVWWLEQGSELDSHLGYLIESALAGNKPSASGQTLDLDGAARVGREFDAITKRKATALEARQ